MDIWETCTIKVLFSEFYLRRVPLKRNLEFTFKEEYKIGLWILPSKWVPSDGFWSCHGF